MIKEKERVIRFNVKLFVFLWIDIVQAAVYLYNCTLKYSFRWKSFYEAFYITFTKKDGVVVERRRPD